MVDREGRDRLALGLRRLAGGRITNDAFDEGYFERYLRLAEVGKCECGYSLAGLPRPRCPECGVEVPDPALSEVAVFAWCLYSDMRKYRLTGRDRLSPQDRRQVARAVLFLKSDLEYGHGDFILRGTSLRPRATSLRHGRRRAADCAEWLLAVGGLLLAVGVFAMLLARLGVARGAAMVVGVLAMLGYGVVRIIRWVVARVWPHVAPVQPQPADSAEDELFQELWPFSSRGELERACARVVYLG